jgi:hypothetical protein
MRTQPLVCEAISVDAMTAAPAARRRTRRAPAAERQRRVPCCRYRRLAVLPAEGQEGPTRAVRVVVDLANEFSLERGKVNRPSDQLSFRNAKRITTRLRRVFVKFTLPLDPVADVLTGNAPSPMACGPRPRSRLPCCPCRCVRHISTSSLAAASATTARWRPPPSLAFGQASQTQSPV